MNVLKKWFSGKKGTCEGKREEKSLPKDEIPCVASETPPAEVEGTTDEFAEPEECQPVDSADEIVEIKNITPKETVEADKSESKEVMQEQTSTGKDVLPEPKIEEKIEKVSESLTKLEENLGQFYKLAAEMQGRLTQIEETVNVNQKTISQVSLVMEKIASLTTSIYEPRHQALLFSLTGIYDLVNQLLNVLPSGGKDVNMEMGSKVESIDLQSAKFLSTSVGEKSDKKLDEIHNIVTSMQECMIQMKESINDNEKKISFFPSQLRMIGGKIDGLTTSVAEPRYRALLLSLLGVYDLVDQFLRAQATNEKETKTDYYRNYEVIRRQLHQILEVNGLTEIPTNGEFNPEIHRAIESILCDDEAKKNQILEVVRPGFRTEQSVLRYTDVKVGDYRPPKENVNVREVINKEVNLKLSSGDNNN